MKLALRIMGIAIVTLVVACTGTAEELDARASRSSSSEPSPSPVAVNPSPDAGAVGGESQPPAMSEDPPATAEDQLRAARDDWAALGVQDYEFTFHRGCFCPPDATGPFRVVVAGGTVVSVDGQPVPSDQDLVPTIPELHARIEQELARGALVEGGYNVTGLPINLYVDPPRPLTSVTEPRFPTPSTTR